MSEIGTSPKKSGEEFKEFNREFSRFVSGIMNQMLSPPDDPEAKAQIAARRREEQRLIAEHLHPKTRRLLAGISPDHCDLPNSFRELIQLAQLPPRVQTDVVTFMAAQALAIANHEAQTGEPWYENYWLTSVEGALDELRWTPERIATIRTSSKKLRKPQKRTVEFHHLVLSVTDRYEQMTVRQLFYQLVGLGLDKTEQAYKRVSDAAVQLRLSGQLPYSKIVDSSRIRRPVYQHGSMSEALENAAEIYRRNYWLNQPASVEIWCEKDALTGVIQPICAEYGVTYVAVRGFSSASLYYESAMALRARGRPTNVYYFGDHDPSGYAISDPLEDELLEHGADATAKRIGLLPHHIREYNLPTHWAKKADSRYKGFVRKYGRQVVELDALPPDVLVAMVRGAIEENIDKAEWDKAKAAEQLERETLDKVAQATRDLKPGAVLRIDNPES